MHFQVHHYACLWGRLIFSRVYADRKYHPAKTIIYPRGKRRTSPFLYLQQTLVWWDMLETHRTRNRRPATGFPITSQSIQEYCGALWTWLLRTFWCSPKWSCVSAQSAKEQRSSFLGVSHTGNPLHALPNSSLGLLPLMVRPPCTTIDQTVLPFILYLSSLSSPDLSCEECGPV